MADKLISLQAALDAIMGDPPDAHFPSWYAERLKKLPPAHPARLTDDDFETIRIHLSAYKERLCDQWRWDEAEEYQRIIDRFMSFASAQPERKTGHWIKISPAGIYECSECRGHIMTKDINCFDFCHRCGVPMKGVIQ